MCCEYTSEQRRQYTPKKPFEKRLPNPPIPCKELQFVKPFQDRQRKSDMQALTPLESIYKRDFKQSHAEVPDEKISLKHYHYHVERYERINIDPAKPGYTKHLDVDATNQRIAYVNNSSNLLAAKDNITFWTWIKNDPSLKYNTWPIKTDLSDKPKVKKNKPRPGEFTMLQRTVPNYGLTTENRSNYKVPDRCLESAFVRSFNP